MAYRQRSNSSDMTSKNQVAENTAAENSGEAVNKVGSGKEENGSRVGVHGETAVHKDVTTVRQENMQIKVNNTHSNLGRFQA